MGNQNSNIRRLKHGNHDNNDKNRLDEQFCHACEIGDLGTARQLLPHLSHIRVNQIQHEGTLALDAAALNGHHNIVQYLLDFEYFRGGRFNEKNLESSIDFQPSFESVRQHTSLDHAQSPQLWMNIANASRLVRPFIRFAMKRPCVDKLTEIIEATRHTFVDENLSELNDLYEAFLKRHNLNALIKIFTLTTPQMSTILRNSVSYSALIYLNLHKFEDRTFKGVSYRGLKESPLNLEHYELAMKHGYIIELKNFMSTTKSFQILEIYRSEKMAQNAHVMTIEFDFRECTCPTALDLTKNPCISQFESEEEVLVLPHTLFRVTHIHHIPITEDNPCEQFKVTFKYVPVIGTKTLTALLMERSFVE